MKNDRPQPMHYRFLKFISSIHTIEVGKIQKLFNNAYLYLLC